MGSRIPGRGPCRIEYFADLPQEIRRTERLLKEVRFLAKDASADDGVVRVA
jgi:hypothetical protein